MVADMEVDKVYDKVADMLLHNTHGGQQGGRHGGRHGGRQGGRQGGQHGDWSRVLVNWAHTFRPKPYVSSKLCEFIKEKLVIMMLNMLFLSKFDHRKLKARSWIGKLFLETNLEREGERERAAGARHQSAEC